MLSPQVFIVTTPETNPRCVYIMADPPTPLNYPYIWSSQRFVISIVWVLTYLRTLHPGPIHKSSTLRTTLIQIHFRHKEVNPLTIPVEFGIAIRHAHYNWDTHVRYWIPQLFMNLTTGTHSLYDHLNWSSFTLHKQYIVNGAHHNTMSSMTAKYQLSMLIKIGPPHNSYPLQMRPPTLHAHYKECTSTLHAQFDSWPPALFAAIVNVTRKIFHIPYVCNPSFPHTQYIIILKNYKYQSRTHP
jgi:hypothetical protein